MSRREFPDPVLDSLATIRRLVSEAAHLGAQFRLSGAAVAIDGYDSLPEPLQRSLARHQGSGRLWDYLGGWQDDGPAIAFASSLGVSRVLIESAQDVRSAIRALIADLRKHKGRLAVDVETAPLPGHEDQLSYVKLKADGGIHAAQPKAKGKAALDPHRADIALLQLYAGGSACFLFRGEALRRVVGSFWLRRRTIIAHNAGFDLAFLRKHIPKQTRIPRRVWGGGFHCTMQATGLLLGVGFGGGTRKLDAAASALLGLTMPKELGTSDWSAARLSRGQVAYAASDPIITWRLWQTMEPRLKEAGRWAAYKLQRDAIPAVVRMEVRGLGFDKQEHARQVQQWSAELEEARAAYKRETGRVPPHTAAEIASWLRMVLNDGELARWPRTNGRGELSTKYEHLELLGHISSARPVLNILAAEKMIGSFGPKLLDRINPVTNRLHCRFNIAATKAGRFSASDPNPQQFPSRRCPEFRRCIAADAGNVLVCCDYNQVELRAAAWVSGDAAMTDLYRRCEDLHAQNAAAIAGVSLDQVSKEQRTAAKAVSFGSLYGISAKGLVRAAFKDYKIEMTEIEAQIALDTFFSRFPQLASWRADNYDRIQQQGFVRIGAGRVVEAAWEWQGQISFPQCCNLPIQGICADAMLRAITIAHARMSAARVRGGLVATRHDELLAEVAAEDAERARDVLQDSMIDAFELTFPGAPTERVAEAKIGPTWADVK